MTSRSDASPHLRNDLDLMLMPFFPDGGSGTFETTLGPTTITIMSIDEGAVATPADRKILNYLAQAVADMVEAGLRPTRHLRINIRELLRSLRGDGAPGGADYQRVLSSLERLSSTRIVTHTQLDENLDRRRQFAWVDAFTIDTDPISPGRNVLAVEVSLSEDALAWIMEGRGYSTPREEFHSITSHTTPVWRIYEVCLAHLLTSGRAVASISIDDLRKRIPISSPLRTFKGRTLRNAMDQINHTPEMAARIRLDLERVDGSRRTAASFDERIPLDRLHVRISPGSGALPIPSRLKLIAQAPDGDASMT